MKKKVTFNLLSLIILALFLSLPSGCTEKDVYDPDFNKDPLPDESEYFDFNTREDVDLYVDYDAPGFKALIEIYDENPLVSKDGNQEKKDGIEALFKIYTDENSKFVGKMNIPTAVKTVYLYTSTWGLPKCVKLEVKDGTVKFDLSVDTTKATTKTNAYAYDFQGSVPYLIDNKRNLYSLCKWGEYGNLIYDMMGNKINNYVTSISQVGNEPIGKFVNRMQNYLVPQGKYQDNSNLVTKSEITNLTLTKKASVNLTFIHKDAEYNNTFGYYYYKKGSTVDVRNIKKYIIFPRVYIATSYEEWWTGISILKSGDKVKLKFFGENGDQAPSDIFPEGYTIGWFIYSNGYDMSDNQDIKANAPLITTNDQKLSYIALSDKKSGKVIIGVEDGGNKSYCDMLFYTEATPEDAIEEGGKPEIPDGEVETPDVEEHHSGTWAFEDIWPSGGDYDMNDVIIEYDRQVSFDNKNYVTKIVDNFTMVHDGASFRNAFAYQINNGQVGKVSLPKGAQLESETSSIIVFENAKDVKGQSFEIIREFTKQSFQKENVAMYNPYIIVRYVENKNSNKRTEVHLPKRQATNKADQTKNGTGKDAYYIDKDGAYPFAIDIPIKNFVPVSESKHIDVEYPKFKSWADSNGSKDHDWYKK